MVLATAIEVAIAIWWSLAAVMAPALHIHEEHLDYAVAAAAPGDGHCDLYVSDTWHQYPDDMQQTFITHEIGHCLGVWEHLDDGPTLGIMSGALVPVFTATDIFAVQNANGVRMHRAFAIFP